MMSEPSSPADGEPFTADLLEVTARSRGSALRPGNILLLRTG
jgi:hypothetical protein